MKPDAAGPDHPADVPFPNPSMRGSKALPERLPEETQLEIPRASLAFKGEGHFVLDAEPEDLKWSPRTISVVLPCAEERDLAFKTVKSVFDTTPADILHEIVVVDDGRASVLRQEGREATLLTVSVSLSSFISQTC